MMTEIKNFFTVVGDISTIVVMLGIVSTAYLAIIGVLPVLYRLGIGLSKAKIAIFAETEFSSLKCMLSESKIFKEKNIMQVHHNDLKKAGYAHIFLVHWKDFRNEMTAILRLKKDKTALVIYAPLEEGRINDQVLLKKINRQRNSVLVNFRGRLMNDILTSLITVNYVR